MQVSDETAELRPRRRRARFTPAMGVLAALLVAALGFIGGVQVQKSRDDGGATASAAPNLPGGGGGQGPPGASGGGGGQAQGLTTGTVKSKRGSTLYVETGEGTTVRVTTGDETDVARTADAGIGSVHPGDSVVIQGEASEDGVVSASQVTATQSGVSAGGFGGFGPPGGGGGGGGGAAPGG